MEIEFKGAAEQGPHTRSIGGAEEEKSVGTGVESVAKNRPAQMRVYGVNCTTEKLYSEC